jgi:chromate transporter
VELLKLAAVLFVINALTIGGGYAMVPLLQRELVEHHQWLTGKEFIDAIAIGQVTPGPLTVMNAFMGFKVAGLAGAIVAMVASYLPCVIIVTFVTHHYLAYRTSRFVRGTFSGIKPAVVGLLAAVLIFLGKTSLVGLTTTAVAAASFGLIAFTRLDPTFVIIGSGLLGALLL